ncbi:MAG: aminotransferase class V-fold PLP-dependent enzyme, partial [Clostridia bacterium]|nr:aminotransferase class V-fold PLP-dependent enzyme [Clostridia bacterium]
GIFEFLEHLAVANDELEAFGLAAFKGHAVDLAFEVDGDAVAVLGGFAFGAHGKGAALLAQDVQGAVSDGADVVGAGVDGQGHVNLNALLDLITADTLLVSIMQVNNEVGAINDIATINRMMKARASNALLHVDGVQGYLKVPCSARDCDLYSISGHKFHAPKGVGALYIKKNVRFLGGQMGGGQENGLRSGTTNTPGILAMETAALDYMQHTEAYRQQMMQCKQRLYQNLMRLPDVVLNGPSPDQGAPHILNLSFLGVGGEVLLHALEEKAIFVSTGSACSAHKKGKNRILNAMGVVGERQEGAIRFSLCHDNTPAEMDETAEAIAGLLITLRRFRRR